MLERIKRKLRRRPVRLAEAVMGVLAALGIAVSPELRESITTLVGVVVPVVVGAIGAEAAQTKTTPLSEPVIPDDHEDDG